MVSTPSPAATLIHEPNSKKRTVEKIKVSSLSRQLRVRLQYAIMKVKKGWHTQTLEDVENLYYKAGIQSLQSTEAGSLIPTTQEEYLDGPSLSDASISFISGGPLGSSHTPNTSALRPPGSDGTVSDERAIAHSASTVSHERFSPLLPAFTLSTTPTDSPLQPAITLKPSEMTPLKQKSPSSAYFTPPATNSTSAFSTLSIPNSSSHHPASSPPQHSLVLMSSQLSPSPLLSKSNALNKLSASLMSPYRPPSPQSPLRMKSKLSPTHSFKAGGISPCPAPKSAKATEAALTIRSALRNVRAGSPAQFDSFWSSPSFLQSPPSSLEV